MAKATLKGIKTNALSRSLALAKVSVAAGAKVASHAVGNLFAKEADKPERLKALLISQIDRLTLELGQLKGSLMKVGQMLSMFGDSFLPPEATALLKTLQSQSPPLEWPAIQKVIEKQLNPKILAQLEIDHEPAASASLGQVHIAYRKSDRAKLAMKIQYPGVDRAIEGDLKALHSLLVLSKLVPTGSKTDQVFAEVQEMLRQEVDYTQELETTQAFKRHLTDDPRVIVPTPYPEYSTPRIFVSSYEEGIPVDSPQVHALSQERRNALGALALEVYFREIFEINAVQTDPHFGNYRVRLGKNGEPDQLVLLDFGAVRKLESPFKETYLRFVRGALSRDPRAIVKEATQLGFLKSTDTPEQKTAFYEFCLLITEPFFPPNEFKDRLPEFPLHLFDASGAYDWGSSDLPQRVVRKATEYAFIIKLRLPPKEILFLDRKVGGIFIFLSGLKVHLRGRDVVAKFLK